MNAMLVLMIVIIMLYVGTPKEVLHALVTVGILGREHLEVVQV